MKQLFYYFNLTQKSSTKLSTSISGYNGGGALASQSCIIASAIIVTQYPWKVRGH